MADVPFRGIAGWLERNKLTREHLIKHSWLKPFASRIGSRELWRFTRRSVPRGVALGMLVGIFLLIPGLQIIGVMLLALPTRANIPIGAAMTFLSMPVTTPFILAGSLYVGNSMLNMGADVSHFMALYERSAPLRDWAAWLLSEAAPALLAGLAIIAIISAAIGYVVASFLWRWWLVRKWNRRKAARKAA
jgi:uncharacterized protein